MSRLASQLRPLGAPRDEVLRQWIETFLTNSHPELGRDGPVCPFAGPALRKELVLVVWIDDADPAEDELVTDLMEFAAEFDTLPPTEGPSALLRTAIVAFAATVDHGLIDRVQQRLKPAFVRSGLMIGQFYPGCAEPGQWNPDFRPLDCPVPLLAVRSMVSSDFTFLSSRADWVAEYLRHYAPQIPAHVRSALSSEFG